MDILSNYDIKSIYKITGTPENFLTALRFGVWGFNIKNKNNWEKLNPGDLIFFHSKGSDSKFLKKASSSIIGFGVVGNNFFIDNTPLWIDELMSDLSYPFKFAFSEFYFFYEIPIDDSWDSTSLRKHEATAQLIRRIVDSGILISELEGFPTMASYSAINNNVIKKKLLQSSRKLVVYKGIAEEESIKKSSNLTSLNSPKESLRYATSLTVFDDIKQRIISNGKKEYSVNLDYLSKAEKAHHSILAHLTEVFFDKGFKVLNNNHVDLFAFKDDKSFLVEAKSIENKNFRAQTRKGIVQLFEYNYFEVSKFKRDNNLEFNQNNKILATSDIPMDNDYIQFINSLDIKTLAIKDNSITSYGQSYDFSNL